MPELIVALLTWISVNTSYDTDFPQPNIVMTTIHNMCQLYGIKDMPRCDSSGLKGFYNKDITIYLGTDFDMNDPHHVSRLLHELVHYVQYKNGKHEHTCLGHLELEAYDLQDNWRHTQGLEPILAAFNRLMLEASC
jgi:hypothetical protein